MDTVVEHSPMTLYAIAPTQFTPDGRSVDAAAMAANVERLAAAGIRHVLLTGAYGEFHSLSDTERISILRHVRATGACASIMACAASLSAEATARLAVAMLEEGADSAMVAPPLACETTDSDVLRHFEYLAKAVGRQLVIYNNPVFGHDLEPRVMAEVMAMDGYVGVKQGSRDTVRLLGSVEAIRATGRTVRIYIASDLSAALTLAAPVDGLTSTNAWVFPDAMLGLLDAASRSDLGEMQRIHRALAPYRRVLARAGQPAGVKAAMHIRGFEGSIAVRAPYTECSVDVINALGNALGECDAAIGMSTSPMEVHS
ncbi:MAG TPA: dihydrodipicolinate synthase family protein [Candidatus Saccharimonadales bacterium]|nr:dihydrodipicolinate synthase family protein [Candidatus Saccharimonadales bacterium]